MVRTLPSQLSSFSQDHEMATGQILSRQSLTSANDAFTLVHQNDGNLVLYRNIDQVMLWSSNTPLQRDSTPGCAVLRLDGDLVVYDSSRRVVWSSGTRGRGITRLVVGDDGDVRLVGADGTALWATRTATAYRPHGPRVARGDRIRRGESLARQSLTSSDGRYVVAHQQDGTLAVYPYIGTAVWSDGNLGPGSRIILDENGRLLVRRAEGGTKVWVEGGVAEVILLNTGHLVAVDRLGTALWSSQIHDSLPGVSRQQDAPPWSGRHLRPFAGWFVQPSERHG